MTRRLPLAVVGLALLAVLLPQRQGPPTWGDLVSPPRPRRGGVPPRGRSTKAVAPSKGGGREGGEGGLPRRSPNCRRRSRTRRRSRPPNDGPTFVTPTHATHSYPSGGCLP